MQRQRHVDPARASRRGPDPLPAGDRREHCVSVRLNRVEVAQLDARRGKFQRGEWLRMAALHQLPPTVPPINQEAWVALARSAGNLNQLARHLNEGDAPALDEIRAELAGFRGALLAVIHERDAQD